MSTVNDPVRLVADPGCPESQRALLQHGVNITPPRDAEARVWMALVGSLGAAAAGGATAAADASTKTVTTTAGVKTGLVSMKIIAVVAGLTALAAVVALGSYVFGPKTREPRDVGAAAPVPTVETPAGVPQPPPPVPAVETPPVDAPPPPATTVPARTAPGAHRAVRSPARRLGDETTLIKDARQALRAGDAARALRLLEESRRLFPAGVLQQERERLAIEALAKAGRGAEASARANAFLKKYPDSPHANEIRARGLGSSGQR